MRAENRNEAEVARNAAACADVPVLQVRGLSKEFSRNGKAAVRVLSDVTFSIHAGECMGLVGASGSGKTTTARLIMRFADATAGEIVLEGRDITRARGAELRQAYRRMQMVFQDPAVSFDPRRTIGHGICEALRNAGMPKAEALERAARLMARCELDPAYLRRFPREVSGGQCQRAGIARALASEPALLVCDEPTSALDACVQKRVARLIRKLCEEMRLAVLFISHDIALVSEVCDTVGVMHEGRIVEQGPVREILGMPKHEQTRRLIDSVLI